MPGGMVNLAVDEHDGFNAGVTNAFFRLNSGKGFQLRANIGGRIKQQPVFVVGAHRNG